MEGIVVAAVLAALTLAAAVTEHLTTHRRDQLKAWRVLKPGHKD